MLPQPYSPLRRGRRRTGKRSKCAQVRASQLNHVISTTSHGSRAASRPTCNMGAKLMATCQTRALGQGTIVAMASGVRLICELKLTGRLEREREPGRTGDSAKRIRSLTPCLQNDDLVDICPSSPTSAPFLWGKADVVTSPVTPPRRHYWAGMWTDMASTMPPGRR